MSEATIVIVAMLLIYRAYTVRLRANLLNKNYQARQQDVVTRIDALERRIINLEAIVIEQEKNRRFECSLNDEN